MNQTLVDFRKAVSDSSDLQDKIKSGADLVALGKETADLLRKHGGKTGAELK